MLAQARDRVKVMLTTPRLPQLVKGDRVELDVRRHWIALVVPVARTVSGLSLVLLDLGGWFLLAFAVLCWAWARRRLRAKGRYALIVVVIPLLVVVLADSLLGRSLVALALLLWLGEDMLDWVTDRLVVTSKRVYRMYGVLTTHSPSIALTGLAFIDPQQSVLGRVLGYGSIVLDSAAQRDEPLSGFHHLPNPDSLHAEMLELRARAIPKFPPPA